MGFDPMRTHIWVGRTGTMDLGKTGLGSEDNKCTVYDIFKLVMKCAKKSVSYSVFNC